MMLHWLRRHPLTAGLVVLVALRVVVMVLLAIGLLSPPQIHGLGRHP